MTESIESFAALQLPAPILTVLSDVGYEIPTPIQAACIPHLLAGRDLLGEAQTGTGKTAAFALPLLAQLDIAKKMPQVLVLTPTRELAIQVAEAFQKYAHNMPGFHVLPVYGGQSMVIQLRALSRGVHVIVGTPGRIMDHLERKSLQLDNLRTLVLDEADEMLRMGFIDDVQWILEHTPATRQTALFSATMPAPIRRIAQRYLRDPQEVRIHSATTTVATIRQRYWQVRGADKLEALTRMLEVEEDFEAALIFVRTKLATVDLAEKLEARGYEAAALHGDMTQGLREQVIERLKSGSLDIVIATDVAARGLDVPRISHVINYDVPYDTESYVHRIGRTGRAGRPGNAILFVAPREMRMLKAIEHATRQPIEAIGLPTKGEVAERRIGQFKQQILDVLSEENLDFFFEVVRRMESEENIATRQIAAALAFLAQRERPLQPPGFDVPALPVAPAAPAARTASAAPVRAERPTSQETRRAVPSVSSPPGGRTPQSGVFGGGSFERPVREPRADREERPERAERKERPAPRNLSVSGSQVVRYRIEVGKNQGALPKEIVGAIANEGGIDGKLIGQINLFDDYSTVELPELPAEVLDILQRTRVRQLPLKIRVAAVGEGEARSRPPVKPRWEKEREPAREARERRPASADFGRSEVTSKPPGRPAFSDKPPYRSEKKPAQRETGGRTERGALPAGKPFNKFPGKPKKY